VNLKDIKKRWNGCKCRCVVTDVEDAQMVLKRKAQSAIMVIALIGRIFNYEEMG
jgi:hypothetical protein